MNNKPIILDSTPDTKRVMYAIIVHIESKYVGTLNERVSEIPSKIHSIWDTYEDAKKQANKCRKESPQLYIECVQINVNSTPRDANQLVERERGWSNWRILRMFLLTPPEIPKQKIGSVISRARIKDEN